MIRKTEPTHWARIYMSGPIEIAKQTLRSECLAIGLCVTIEPTTFIYTGGEEIGFVVGLVNYPRFPKGKDEIDTTAQHLMDILLRDTCQHSAMLMTPEWSYWVSNREDVTVARP